MRLKDNLIYEYQICMQYEYIYIYIYIQYMHAEKYMKQNIEYYLIHFNKNLLIHLLKSVYFQ